MKWRRQEWSARRNRINWSATKRAYTRYENNKELYTLHTDAHAQQNNSDTFVNALMNRYIISLIKQWQHIGIMPADNLSRHTVFLLFFVGPFFFAACLEIAQSGKSSLLKLKDLTCYRITHTTWHFRDEIVSRGCPCGCKQNDRDTRTNVRLNNSMRVCCAAVFSTLARAYKLIMCAHIRRIYYLLVPSIRRIFHFVNDVILGLFRAIFVLFFFSSAEHASFVAKKNMNGRTSGNKKKRKCSQTQLLRNE